MWKFWILSFSSFSDSQLSSMSAKILIYSKWKFNFDSMIFLYDKRKSCFFQMDKWNFISVGWGREVSKNYVIVFGGVCNKRERERKLHIQCYVVIDCRMKNVQFWMKLNGKIFCRQSFSVEGRKEIKTYNIRKLYLNATQLLTLVINFQIKQGQVALTWFVEKFKFLKVLWGYLNVWKILEIICYFV